MRASEPYLSTERNRTSVKHGLAKNAYLAPMGVQVRTHTRREKTRQELKAESYVRDPNTISGRITLRMEELGLQASDLAEPAGITITGVQYLLKGASKYPRPTTLFGLADFLGLEPRYLGTGKGPRLIAEAMTTKRQPLLHGKEGAVSHDKSARNRKTR